MSCDQNSACTAKPCIASRSFDFSMTSGSEGRVEMASAIKLIGNMIANKPGVIILGRMGRADECLPSHLKL